MAQCKINCSGGCGDCAPEEHAFDKWWDKDSGNYLETAEATAESIFYQGWAAGRKYEKADALEVRGEH